MNDPPYFVGTAGWSIASRYGDRFSTQGSHLERYARRLGAVEINSSFYRPHRPATYERWSASVPEDFRFSVKVPKAMTHERGLADCGPLIDMFAAQLQGLGEKLGVLLVQLPPSLKLDSTTASVFLTSLKAKTEASVVCEPRHGSWFTPQANMLLKDLGIARVAADPSLHDGADEPGGYPGLVYFRMHGSPRLYRSDYAGDALLRLTQQLRHCRDAGKEVWCIFDNTAEGHALGNALTVSQALSERTLRPEKKM